MGLYFNSVSDKVKQILNARSTQYSLDNRAPSTYKFLYKKMAYANVTATAYNDNLKRIQSVSIEVPTLGGFGDDNNGMYRDSTQTEAGKFIPKPSVQKVVISNEGDFGSIRKCQIFFTLSSRTDLETYKFFFTIGAKVKVDYGWTDADAGGSNGYFDGIIYNFSFVVNDNGGYDCVTFGIGPSIVLTSTDIRKAKTFTDDKSLNSNQGTNTQNTLINSIKTKTAKLSKLYQNENGYVLLPSILGNANSNREVYISLEKLIEHINNDVLFEYPNTANSKLKIVCNSTVSRGSLPKDLYTLVSADPTKVVFPGASSYYETSGTDPQFQGITVIGQDKKFADLSKILISFKWLTDIFTSIGEQVQDGQKYTQSSVSKFLGIIFESIKENSGGRWKLSLMSDPKDIADSSILVTDYTYVESNITPYEIRAVLNGGVCRRMNLSSAVPSELIAVAYVSTTAELNQGSRGSAAINQITAITNIPDKTKELDANQIKDLKDKFKKLKKEVVGVRTDNDEYKTKVSQLQAALASLYTNVEKSSTKEAFPIPVSFSFTLDGIEGFYFGNAVTCDYLPLHFRGINIAFTVTKIEHVIQNHDWETNISTVCRIVM